MRAVAVIQARMSSSRLPGKVLLPLGDMPVLAWSVRAARTTPGIAEVVVATSQDASDDSIAAWCGEQKIHCVRGSLADVLSRFADAARASKADVVMRLTADCPLLDPFVCGEVLALVTRAGAAYASNTSPRSWPDGLDCEVFTSAALYQAEREATLVHDREHVTPYIRRHQAIFSARLLACPLPDLARERWTLDYEEDLAMLSALVANLPQDRAPSYLEVLAALDADPLLRKRNESRLQAVYGTQPDVPEHSVFDASSELLTRAQAVIPLGAQTFSKSAVQFPAGHAPLFVTHGERGRLFDVDGNEYVDLVCGLLPVVLGYCDADVDEAIRAQLSRGISFSLSTVLEAELAEKMRSIIPCAERVRFAKNGSDATAAAIRLARAFTGRDRVMICGYHGWQDWYIGATTRHKGVPKAVRELTHMVVYNDLAAVESMLMQHESEFAALIMEPVNVAVPSPDYFSGLKKLLQKHGVLLVFDEVITGFRMSLGGAQQYFGVTPDLACFGKAMANGMPLSAVCGRADVMREMEDIFFSGTFGGEALSLAASLATIAKMQREPVIETLWKTGAMIRVSVNEKIKAHNLEHVVRLNGMDPWVLLDFLPQPTASREAIKTLFITQMAASGVLTFGSHNICYAHDAADVARVLAAYDRFLARLADDLKSGELEKRLPCKPLQPVFRVR